MKILLALAVFFLISTQLLAEEIRADDGLNYWSDWTDSDQIKVSPGPQLVLVGSSRARGAVTVPRESAPVSLAGAATATSEASGGGGVREDVQDAAREVPGEGWCPPPTLLPRAARRSRGLTGAIMPSVGSPGSSPGCAPRKVSPPGVMGISGGP